MTPRTDKLLEDDMFREDRDLSIFTLTGHARTLEKELAEAKAALGKLLERHVQLVACGDCGNWDVETEPEVIAARALLTI